MFNPYMALALEQAQIALSKNEVPVGAVIVKGGKVLALAHNLRETENKSTSHAEILAINKACEVLGNWRLDDCDIYVSLEPCIMCAGAILNSRIKNVYFGAYDKSMGAFGTILDCTKQYSIHTPQVYGGIMEDSCNEILNSFFNNIR